MSENNEQPSGSPLASPPCSAYLVRAKENPWNWWFEIGGEYWVRPYAYQATSGAHNTYCHCEECYRERAGKELYDCWEVVRGDKRGSIIPRIHTEVIEPNVGVQVRGENQ